MNNACTLLTGVLLAAALAAPGAAYAQTILDASNVNGIAAIAQEYGSAEVEEDNTGDPMLSGEMGGTEYVVFFYGCTDGADCQTIQFLSSWVNPGAADIDSINAWNREKRFGKAFLDDENDPVIEMNVNLYAGVTETNLSDTFDWWRVVMENFEDHIGFESANEPVAPVETPVTREAEADAPPATTGAPSAIGMGHGTQSGGSKVKVNR